MRVCISPLIYSDCRMSVAPPQVRQVQTPQARQVPKYDRQLEVFVRGTDKPEEILLQQQFILKVSDLRVYDLIRKFITHIYWKNKTFKNLWDEKKNPIVLHDTYSASLWSKPSPNDELSKMNMKDMIDHASTFRDLQLHFYVDDYHANTFIYSKYPISDSQHFDDNVKTYVIMTDQYGQETTLSVTLERHMRFMFDLQNTISLFGVETHQYARDESFEIDIYRYVMRMIHTKRRTRR